MKTIQFPFVASVPDTSAGINGIKRLLKQLGRSHGVKVEWLPSRIAPADAPSGNQRATVTATERKTASEVSKPALLNHEPRTTDPLRADDER